MTEPEAHEFESFDEKCHVPVGLGLLPCGQPKDAACHVVILTTEEKLAAMRFDSEYQFRARRILKESELSVGIPLAANSVPNDLAIRIAIALAERDKLASHYAERPLELQWGEHQRDGGTHIEWHAPCGCSYHPQPFPHVHPCSDAHRRPS